MGAVYLGILEADFYFLAQRLLNLLNVTVTLFLGLEAIRSHRRGFFTKTRQLVVETCVHLIISDA